MQMLFQNNKGNGNESKKFRCAKEDFHSSMIAAELNKFYVLEQSICIQRSKW